MVKFYDELRYFLFSSARAYDTIGMISYVVNVLLLWQTGYILGGRY